MADSWFDVIEGLIKLWHHLEINVLSDSGLSVMILGEIAMSWFVLAEFKTLLLLMMSSSDSLLSITSCGLGEGVGTAKPWSHDSLRAFMISTGSHPVHKT